MIVRVFPPVAVEPSDARRTAFAVVAPPSVAPHLPELRPPGHPRRLRRMRGRDHDVVTLPQQLRQLLHRPEPRDLRRTVRRPRVHGDDAHPERARPPRDLPAGRAEADDAARRVGEVAGGAIEVVDGTRPRREADQGGFPAGRGLEDDHTGPETLLVTELLPRQNESPEVQVGQQG